MFHYFRCYLSTVKVLQQQIFILHRNLSKTILTSEIGSDTDNSENCTITDNINYTTIKSVYAILGQWYMACSMKLV